MTGDGIVGHVNEGIVKSMYRSDLTFVALVSPKKTEQVSYWNHGIVVWTVVPSISYINRLLNMKNGIQKD